MICLGYGFTGGPERGSVGLAFEIRWTRFSRLTGFALGSNLVHLAEQQLAAFYVARFKDPGWGNRDLLET